MIPGDLLSAFPNRQFHTLPSLLDSRAALPNAYPNTLCAMQGGSLYHFYDGLWYDPTERRTHDLPCEADTLPTEPTRHGYTLYRCTPDAFLMGVKSCYNTYMVMRQDQSLHLRFTYMAIFLSPTLLYICMLYMFTVYTVIIYVTK